MQRLILRRSGATAISLIRKLSCSSARNLSPKYDREFCSESARYYYRARYYDATIGRFLSEDRARFAGGFDFYAYVKNDPVDFLDPTGLKCWQSSPWVEIPQMWDPKGLSPYLTIEDDGLFWVPTGWSFVPPGRVACVCDWISTHKRTRKFYRVTVEEQAEFTCDCPSRSYYETRERVREWEVDTPGSEFWPPAKTQTPGATFQLGGNVGAHPVFKGTVECTCVFNPPEP